MMVGVRRASSGYGQLDYALARIHGRLARVPGESVWTALAPLERYDHYVDAAGQQGMGYWVQGLRRDADVHELEAALRRRFDEEMRRLRDWTPPGFDALLRWCALLPYLGFVGYLYRRETPQPWMREDPVLAGWLASGPAAGALVELQRGLDSARARHQVIANWVAGLLSRLPGALQGLADDRTFTGLVHAVADGHPMHEAGTPPERRGERRLLRAVHRHIMAPALVPLYALLVHWVLLRLRGELVPRLTSLERRG